MRQLNDRSAAIGRVAAAVLFCATAPVSAQSIDDNTKCAEVADAMAAPSPDKPKIRQIINYILETMENADHDYGLKGKTEIIPRMSNEGRFTTIAAVTATCADKRDKAVRDVAIETYNSFRAMQDGAGLNR